MFIWRDKWQKFEKKTYDGFHATVAWTLEQLDLFDSAQKQEDNYIFSQEFADTHRKGMKVINGGQLQQFRMYLKGVYFQAAQNYKYALYWYSNSLHFSANSVNLWRLQSLEAIA